MSVFQKQLLARRGKAPNRVNLKQKKILAMMEEEAVIDDSAKNARLLSYKKTEVMHVCRQQQWSRSSAGL